MNASKSILVVGAGLSGICVTLQLLNHGCSVTLIDNSVNHSSRVAAGMINPLVFRRMTKSWRVDDFMPFLKRFYTELENETGSSFFHPIQIRRLFSSEQEHDFWLENEKKDSFLSYMHPLSPDDYSYGECKNPFGSGRVKESSFVDVNAFMNATLSLIQKSSLILKESFDANQLNRTNYKGVDYDEIVFCQGYLNSTNPFFNTLPIDPTKGQVLTVSSKTIPKDISINRKCFVLPLGGNSFKVGSTYEWHNTTLNCTKEAKNDILKSLAFLTEEEVVVISQAAGIRPTTRDRRPTIGTHQEHKNYHIFNGLGAKGYMLAPLLSREFVDYLILGTKLTEEVNIIRFKS